MTTMLKIDASLAGTKGISHRLTDAFVATWLEREPGARIIKRDLVDNSVPHLTLRAFDAGMFPVDARSPEQQRDAALADALIEELFEADVVLLGVSTYNFSLPSPIKAWFDHIAAPKRPFGTAPMVQ